MQTEQLDTFRSEYTAAVLSGDSREATRVVSEAKGAGLTTERLYLDLFCPSQIEIGERWHRGEVSIAEEHRATHLTISQMENLRAERPPLIRNGNRAVVATLEGESHSLGAKIVADFLYFDGWEVHFLGANLPETELIKFVDQVRPHLVGLSICVAASLPASRAVIAKLRARENAPKILVGGALFRSQPELIDSIGADGVMKNAEETVETARELIGLGDPSLTLESYLKELGERILRLRKGRSMSQQELANAANLDRTYISAVEHGKQNVTIGAIVKLSTALKVSLKSLLAGD